MRGNSIAHREICELDAATALPPLPSHVCPGALVVARAMQWRLEGCVDRADCRELPLRAASGADRRVLLWPFDRPAPAAATRSPRVLPLGRWTRRGAAGRGGQREPVAPRAARRRGV